MNDSAPTPEQARSALAEADSRALEVRHSDSQFRFILLALAATYVAIGVVVGRFPGGGHFAGPVVLAIFAGGIALTVVLFWRVKAYSKQGVLRFSLYCSGFTIWNSVVIGVSFASGWLGPRQPGWHFTLSTVAASIPLVVAAWLLARRRG